MGVVPISPPHEHDMQGRSWFGAAADPGVSIHPYASSARPPPLDDEHYNLWTVHIDDVDVIQRALDPDDAL